MLNTALSGLSRNRIQTKSGRKRNRTATVSFSGLYSTIELSPCFFTRFFSFTNHLMKFISSRYKLLKRYLRFTNSDVYFSFDKLKRLRLGYKLYQKTFRRFKTRRALRINVRKPRIATRRKTIYGRALEAKQKWSYLIGGLHASKLSRFVRSCKSKVRGHSMALSDALESRLDVLVVKTCLTPNSWDAKALVKRGYVYVNGRCIRRVHFKVPLYAKVSINLPLQFISLFFRRYRTNLYRRFVFWRVIPGFVFSRKTFTLIKYKRITPSMVIYPFDFAAGYFFRLYPH